MSESKYMTCGTNHVPRATQKYPIFEVLKPNRLHLASVRVRPLGSHLQTVRVRVEDDSLRPMGSKFAMILFSVAATTVNPFFVGSSAIRLQSYNFGNTFL